MTEDSRVSPNATLIAGGNFHRRAAWTQRRTQGRIIEHRWNRCVNASPAWVRGQLDKDAISPPLFAAIIVAP